MANSESNIGRLNVRVGADIGDFRTNMNNVRTQLNNTSASVSKNTSNITSSFNSMKLAMLAAKTAIVFGLASLAKESIGVYNTFNSANLGLKSILEAQGRSFKDAKGFIDDYISDGLVPLADAVTAYKSLAARGYNDEQIKNTLTRLKDAAAFGRQSSLSIGEAVKSASEGLKNENSILVDNAGVTKNVAKMWDEYAGTIGKTANNLTQQEKIQAEVNGIMKETAFQVGDAAKYSQTLGGQLTALSAFFMGLKNAIGSALAPILGAILPTISMLITKFTQLFTVIGQFNALLFGSSKSQKQSSSSASDAADAQTALGNATKKAGDKAKKSIAGFDEINSLQESMADNADSAASAVSSVGTPQVTPPDAENIIPKSIIDAVDSFKKKFSNMKDIVVDFYNNWGLKDLFEGIRGSIESIDTSNILDNLGSLGSTISSAILGAVPAIQSAAQNLGALIGKGIGSGIQVAVGFIDGVLEGIVTSIPLFFANLDLSTIATSFSNIFGSIAGIIQDITPSITDAATKLGSLVGTAITGSLAVVYSIFDSITLGLSQFFQKNSEKIGQIVNDIVGKFSDGFSNLKSFYTTIFGLILSTLDTNKQAIADTVGGIANTLFTAASTIGMVVGDIFSIATGKMATWAETSRQQISDTFNNVVTIATDSMNLLNLVVTDALNLISEFWTNWGADIFSGIVNIFTDILKWFMQFYNEFLAPLFKVALEWLKKIWQDNLKGIIDQVLGFVGRLGEILLLIYKNFIKPLIDYFMDKMLPEITNAIHLLMDIIGSIVDVIAGIVKNLLKILNGLIDFLVGVFTGDWNKVWTGVKGIFDGIVGALGEVFKGAINIIISVINFFIRKLNSIKINIPEVDIPLVGKVGGGSVGFPALPEIPMLAKGGIVDNPTLAMIGEKGKEAVVPLENTSFVDTIAGAIGNSVLSAFQFANSSNNSQSGGSEIIMQIDSTAFAKLIIPALKNEENRTSNFAMLQGV